MIGPYQDRSNPDLFQAAMQAAQAQGYQPTTADASSGQFTVASNVHTFYGAGAQFTVQCYQEGWIRVVPAGPNVYPAGATFSVPPALKSELESFVIRMRESLGSTRVTAE